MHLDPVTRAAVVTLFGTIIFDTTDGRLLLDVRQGLGDADRFGFVGELWLARKQCKVEEAQTAGQLDMVKISYPLAVALSQTEASRRTRSR